MSKVYYNVKDIPKSYKYAIYFISKEEYISFRSYKQAREYILNNDLFNIEVIVRRTHSNGEPNCWVIIYYLGVC